jgi:AraC-like DNA-binding protein
MLLQEYPFAGEKGTLLDVQFYQGSQCIPLHMHDFSEFVVVHNGSCIYQYQGRETLLVAGDVFFIPPYHAHGYRYDTTMEFYNCQFYADRLGAHWDSILHDTVLGENLYVERNSGPFSWDYDLRDISLIDLDNETQDKEYGSYFKEHRIIHLDGEEKETIEGLLESIRYEQDKKKSGYEYLKQAYLTIILTTIKRIMEKQSRAMELGPSRKKSVIYEALRHIDENYAENINFSEFAQKNFITPNHFRQLFKKVTGVSPVNYLNRVRVIKSLQFIQLENMSISDAAAKVGVYDANYFSRMFKKIMGYSPRYFKSISK